MPVKPGEKVPFEDLGNPIVQVGGVPLLAQLGAPKRGRDRSSSWGKTAVRRAGEVQGNRLQTRAHGRCRRSGCLIRRA